MEIGIIGSGNIGGTLTRHLTRLGHHVLVANSRGPETLGKLAAETGATAVTAEQAARAKDMVFISIPEKAVPQLPRDILAKSSAVIVDTGNYYPIRDGRIEEIESGTVESAWVGKQIGRPVIKAFNNIVSNNLGTRGVSAGSPNRIALPVAGDDTRAKKFVLDLVEAIGFDAVDSGKIADSWRQQPGTPVYAADLDAKRLKAALAQADPKRVSDYRAQAMEAARAWFR